MIMIGPGTGVAPFRGFLQAPMWHKQNGASALGTAMLFFCCRHPYSDYMYSDEMERSHRDGIVDLSVAYSRLGDAQFPEAGYHQVKGYVQQAIEARGEEVWRLIEAGAVIYVCGDAASMLPDVKRPLAALAQRFDSRFTGPEGQVLADQWLSQLEHDSRFLVDAWA